MRLVLVNRFYWPDEPATAQLLTDLAEALAADGHEVNVVTSRPVGADVPLEETRAGVRIVRTRSARYSPRLGLGGKAIDYFSFLLSAGKALRREARPGTIIVSMTDPPLLGVSAARAAQRQGASLVHWVQDIYPEIAMELTGQRWLSVFQSARDRAWRAAAACVTLGEDMAGVLRRSGVAEKRIHVVPNVAPRELSGSNETAAAALREKWGLAGKFVVQYSGNLGRVHDLQPLLVAAELLRGDTKIVFLFVGDGPQRPALEADAIRRRLPNVKFLGPQPRSLLAASLRVGDLHLVTLRPGCEQYVFPSKLAGAMAVGRGIVFVGPRTSDVARILSSTDAGVVFSREQMSELATTLRELASNPLAVTRLGANAARHAPRADAQLDAWRQVLLEVSRDRIPVVNAR